MSKKTLLIATLFGILNIITTNGQTLNPTFKIDAAALLKHSKVDILLHLHLLEFHGKDHLLAMEV